MSKPTMDDAVAALEKIAETVTEIGVAKVAQTAGVPERIVRKFVRDVLESKNSDIRKITGAVKELAS